MVMMMLFKVMYLFTSLSQLINKSNVVLLNLLKTFKRVII